MKPKSKTQNKCYCLCHQADEESNSLDDRLNPLFFGVPVWSLLMVLALLEDDPDPKTKGELKP